MNKILLYVFCIVLSSISLPSFSADPPIYSHPKKGAIKGVDVVAYFSLKPGEKAVKGKDEYTYLWNGAQWKFSTEENMKKFVANPEAYAPQYGGYCAFAVSHGFTASIRPNSWKIIDNKLYLNYSRISYMRWKFDVEDKIKEADENWPEVLKVCEKRGNCKSN